MVVPTAYGNSQARRWIRAVALAYTTATATSDLSCICNLHHSFGNAGSLIHWVRPGFKPTSSERQHWILNLLSHNCNIFVLFFFVYLDTFDLFYGFMVLSISIVYGLVRSWGSLYTFIVSGVLERQVCFQRNGKVKGWWMLTWSELLLNRGMR